MMNTLNDAALLNNMRVFVDSMETKLHDLNSQLSAHSAENSGKTNESMIVDKLLRHESIQQLLNSAKDQRALNPASAPNQAKQMTSQAAAPTSAPNAMSNASINQQPQMPHRPQLGFMAQAYQPYQPAVYSTPYASTPTPKTAMNPTQHNMNIHQRQTPYPMQQTHTTSNMDQRQAATYEQQSGDMTYQHKQQCSTCKKYHRGKCKWEGQRPCSGCERFHNKFHECWGKEQKKKSNYNKKRYTQPEQRWVRSTPQQTSMQNPQQQQTQQTHGYPHQLFYQNEPQHQPQQMHGYTQQQQTQQIHGYAQQQPPIGAYNPMQERQNELQHQPQQMHGYTQQQQTQQNPGHAQQQNQRYENDKRTWTGVGWNNHPQHLFMNDNTNYIYYITILIVVV
eukprot:483501_1